MSELNNTHKLRTAIEYLIQNECDMIDLDLSVNYSGKVEISTEPERITRKEVQQLKRAFGPLEPSPNWSYEHKNLRGERFLVGTEIKFEITNALTCKKLDLANATDEVWEEIKQAALRGEISIPDCRPSDYKNDEPVEDNEDDDFDDDDEDDDWAS